MIINGVLSPVTGSRMVILYAEQTFLLVNEAISAAANDRILIHGQSSLFIDEGKSAILLYDTDSIRWRYTDIIVL